MRSDNDVTAYHPLKSFTMTPTLKTVAPGIWTVKHFFTPEECQNWIEFSEEQGYEKAKIGPGKVSIRTRIGPGKASIRTKIGPRKCRES